MEQLPLVTIRCTVYNHEPYLRQCLDGFIMQKTNFPFEAIVHDDASTDGSAKIIREYAEKYPDIIKPIYQIENQYSKRDGSLSRIMNEATRGKYVAMCEGDDYWIDPLKLQKQVDFLESHSTYGMCYTKCRRFYQNSLKFTLFSWGGRNETFEDLLLENTIPTLTVMLRMDLLVRYVEDVKPWDKEWLMGDLPMWLWFSFNSKIKFCNRVTGVYRILNNSSSHSDNEEISIAFLKSRYSILFFYIDKYNVCSECINRLNHRQYSGISTMYILKGRKNKALDVLLNIKNKSFYDYMKIAICKNDFLYDLYTKIRIKLL